MPAARPLAMGSLLCRAGCRAEGREATCLVSTRLDSNCPPACLGGAKCISRRDPCPAGLSPPPSPTSILHHRPHSDASASIRGLRRAVLMLSCVTKCYTAAYTMMLSVMASAGSSAPTNDEASLAPRSRALAVHDHNPPFALSF